MKKLAALLFMGVAASLAGGATSEQLLFKVLETARRNGPGNVLISPFGIRQCYGMISPGAGPVTGADLKKVLGLEPAGLPDMLKKVRSLRQAKAETKFSSFNTVVVDKRYTLKPAYRTAVEKQCEGTIRQADLKKAAESAEMLNKLIAQQSNGLFTNAFDKADLKNEPAVVLLNVLYFKARWAMTFKKEGTEKRPFTLADGKKKEVDMMHAKWFVPYYNDGKVHGIVLDYKDRRFKMFFLMPVDAKTPLSAVTELLASQGVPALMAKATQERKTAIRLPKLKLQCSVDLVELLRKAGMTAIFDPDRGAIVNMVERFPLYIGKSKQVVKLTLDENGTEAAAATYAIGMVGAAFGPPPKTNTFHADRPFVLVLTDTETQTDLLSAVVMEP